MSQKEVYLCGWLGGIGRICGTDYKPCDFGPINQYELGWNFAADPKQCPRRINFEATHEWINGNWYLKKKEGEQ